MSSFFVFVSFCFWHHCPRKSSRFGRIDVSNCEWAGKCRGSTTKRSRWISQRFERQIDANSLVRLQERRAASGIAENQKLGRPEAHTDSGGSCRMVNARKNR